MTIPIPELIERLRNKARLFLSSAGADPYMKIEDVTEWKAADALESMQARVKEQDKTFTETFDLMQFHLMDSQHYQARVKELEADIVIVRGEKRLVSEFTNE